jgi:hypothetical protein
LSECEKCGHFSLITTDDGNLVPGCSGVKLVFDDFFREIKKQNIGKIEYDFEPFDPSFQLNANGDCFLYIKQTPQQINQIKKLLEVENESSVK